jgi:hypothetical protein
MNKLISDGIRSYQHLVTQDTKLLRLAFVCIFSSHNKSVKFRAIYGVPGSYFIEVCCTLFVALIERYVL